MSDFTPGPWTLCAHMAETDEGCHCGYMGNVWGRDEETIVAFLGHCQPHEDVASCSGDLLAAEPTRRANARLIAAAPKMYDTLVAVIDYKHLLPEWLVDEAYAVMGEAASA